MLRLTLPTGTRESHQEGASGGLSRLPRHWPGPEGRGPGAEEQSVQTWGSQGPARQGQDKGTVWGSPAHRLLTARLSFPFPRSDYKPMTFPKQADEKNKSAFS